jgi:hypothetical protein
MALTLVHMISHEQPKTAMELLNIATRYASDGEAVRAAFTLGEAGVAAVGGRMARPNITVRGTKKGAKGGKKGQKALPTSSRCNGEQRQYWGGDREL